MDTRLMLPSSNKYKRLVSPAIRLGIDTEACYLQASRCSFCCARMLTFGARWMYSNCSGNKSYADPSRFERAVYAEQINDKDM